MIVDIGHYCREVNMFMISAWLGFSEQTLLEPRVKDKPWKLNDDWINSGETQESDLSPQRYVFSFQREIKPGIMKTFQGL